MNIFDFLPDYDIGKPVIGFLLNLFISQKVLIIVEHIEFHWLYCKINNEVQGCGAAQLAVYQAHSLGDLRLFPKIINEPVFHLEFCDAHGADHCQNKTQCQDLFAMFLRDTSKNKGKGMGKILTCTRGIFFHKHDRGGEHDKSEPKGDHEAKGHHHAEVNDRPDAANQE